MKPLFKGLYHVCLYVNDFDATMAFYKACGFTIALEQRMTPDDMPWNVLLKVSECQFLELQPLAARRPFPAPKIAVYRDDATCTHFSLLSDDLASTISELAAQGISAYTGPDATVTVADGGLQRSPEWLYAWLIDPDGNPIEIMQEL